MVGLLDGGHGGGGIGGSGILAPVFVLYLMRGDNHPWQGALRLNLLNPLTSLDAELWTLWRQLVAMEKRGPSGGLRWLLVSVALVRSRSSPAVSGV